MHFWSWFVDLNIKKSSIFIHWGQLMSALVCQNQDWGHDQLEKVAF